MACTGEGIMADPNLCQAHLKEVGLTQNWETIILQKFIISFDNLLQIIV